MNQSLLNIENFVFQLFKDNLSLDFTYHNFMHTVKVVEAIKILSIKEQLSDVQKEKLIIAGWFHDTGYTKIVQGHEIESANIAKIYLEKQNFSESDNEEIQKFILATTLNHEPTCIEEAIIKDADNHHVGELDYQKICELLRNEIGKVCNKEFTDYEWSVENRNFFLTTHHFFTDSAKNLWQKGKEENLISIQNKIKEIENKAK